MKASFSNERNATTASFSTNEAKNGAVVASVAMPVRHDHTAPSAFIRERRKQLGKQRIGVHIATSCKRESPVIFSQTAATKTEEASAMRLAVSNSS